MPITTRFDPLFPAELTGEITEMTVRDLSGTPNRVLELDRPWRISADWRLSGTGADTIAGSWKVSARVESMGSGIEGTVASTSKLLSDVEAGSTATLRLFHVDLNIPAGAIDEQGVYRPVLLITYDNAAGSPRPMAGFADDPMITFYKDEP